MLCRDVSFGNQSSPLVLGNGQDIDVSCNGYRLQLHSQRAPFVMGASSQAIFRDCWITNYLPGGAAKANALKATDLFEIPKTMFGDAANASVTVIDSFLEHPCEVRTCRSKRKEKKAGRLRSANMPVHYITMELIQPDQHRSARCLPAHRRTGAACLVPSTHCKHMVQTARAAHADYREQECGPGHLGR